MRGNRQSPDESLFVRKVHCADESESSSFIGRGRGDDASPISIPEQTLNPLPASNTFPVHRQSQAAKRLRARIPHARNDTIAKQKPRDRFQNRVELPPGKAVIVFDIKSVSHSTTVNRRTDRHGLYKPARDNPDYCSGDSVRLCLGHSAQGDQNIGKDIDPTDQKNTYDSVQLQKGFIGTQTKRFSTRLSACSRLKLRKMLSEMKRDSYRDWFYQHPDGTSERQKCTHGLASGNTTTTNNGKDGTKSDILCCTKASNDDNMNDQCFKRVCIKTESSPEAMHFNTTTKSDENDRPRRHANSFSKDVSIMTQISEEGIATRYSRDTREEKMTEAVKPQLALHRVQQLFPNSSDVESKSQQVPCAGSSLKTSYNEMIDSNTEVKTDLMKGLKAAKWVLADGKRGCYFM